MSDPIIFVAGSVVFITTAWAAFSFGLARFDELARRDADRSPETAVVPGERERS